MTSSFISNEFIANSTAVNTLTFGQKSYRVLATGGDDCKVNIWRFDKSNENITTAWTLTSNKAPIKSLCFDNEEKLIVSGSMNGSIKVFDMSEGKLARNVGGHQTQVSCIQCHPYAEFVASGSFDCTTKLWDVRNKACIFTYNGHDKEVTCLRFSPDGRLLASSSKDGNLVIYDLVAGKPQNTIKMGSTLHVTTFEFNPTEFILATVTSARAVRFYDLDSMEIVCNTPPESSPIKSICFSHDGNRLFACTKDNFRSWTWDPAPMKLQTNVDVAWTKIHEIKVSPTNQLLGGSFQSQFATVWSLDLNYPYQATAGAAIAVKGSGMGSPPPRTGGARTTNSSSKQPSQSQLSIQNVDLPRFPADSGRDNSFGNNLVPSRQRQNDSSAVGQVSSSGQQQQGRAPSRQWATDAASQNLASSMSDTLWRKYREEHLVDPSQQQTESQRLKSLNDDAQYDDEFDNDSVTGSNNGARSANKAGKNESSSSSSNGGNVVQSKSAVSNHMSSIPPESRFSAGQSAPAGSAVSGGGGSGPRSTQPTSARDIEKAMGSLKMADKSNNSNNNNKAVNSGNADRDRGVDRDRGNERPPWADIAEQRDQDVRQSVRQSFNDPLRVIQQQQQSSAVRRSNNDFNVDIFVPSAPSSTSSDAAAGNDTSFKVQAHNSRDSNLRAIDDQITRFVNSSNSLNVALSGRLTNMRMLRKLWQKSDMTEVLEYLKVIHEGSRLDPSQMITLNDFFASINLKSIGLTLTHCLQMLQFFDTMLYDKSETCLTTAVHSLVVLLQAFADLIHDTRHSMNGASMVDLSKEERLQKCNSCVHILLRMKSSPLELIKKTYRKSNRLYTLLNQLQPLIDLAVS